MEDCLIAHPTLIHAGFFFVCIASCNRIDWAVKHFMAEGLQSLTSRHCLDSHDIQGQEENVLVNLYTW